MTIDIIPKSEVASVLNYSIVSISDDDEDEKNALRLKLRVSQRKNLKVIDSPKSEQKHANAIKNDRIVDDLCISLNDRAVLKTPVKRPLADINDNNEERMEISPSKKRGIQTPKSSSLRRQYQQGTKQVSEKLSRNKNGIIASPVKVNLDESFRRSLLRCNLANKFIEESDKKQQSQSTPSSTRECRIVSKQSKYNRISTRTNNKLSYSEYFYDSEEDDREIVEVLKKSEKEAAASPSTRVLRSRSKSSISGKTLKEPAAAAVKTDKTPLRRSTRKSRSVYKHRSPDNEYNDAVDNIEDIIKELKVLIPKCDTDPKTPTKRRSTRKSTVAETPKSSRKSGLKTPKSTLKLLREGVITPSIQARSIKHHNEFLTMTPLSKARSQLHVSYMPASLPCREKEYFDIFNFLKGKLIDGCGGCMYISGVPGTGKTATVTLAIDQMHLDENINNFIFININGMRLSEPRQAYVEIWKQLTDKTVPWEHAQSLLEERFTKKKNPLPIVMLIDELDILCTKRQDVVYNLLDWPTKSKQLIVITIANTMDLPERLLMNRVKSRLGLTRLTFQAYTYKQLVEIVMKRLSGTDSFNSDAIQLVSRKVASVSGDARRALDICRRAAEIAERSNNDEVTLAHVNEALNEMITQPQVLAIKRCSRLQQLILQAITTEIERTGVEETTFIDVYKMLINCCAIDRFKMVTSTVAQKAVYALSANRLIITDQKYGDIYQKIILNVSVHDVYFALKQN